MSLRKIWRKARWRRRFMGETAVRAEQLADGRSPDATVDQVGVPGDDVGFDGRPIHSKPGNGYGTGDPSSPGWAGWGV